jgi:hypothetical protein
MTKGGSQLIKDDPFFENFKWDDLADQTMAPPFVPIVAHDLDTSRFELDEVS